MTATTVDPASADAEAPARLRLAGVSKRYASTTALHEVGLTVGRGEIHALLGGNGSGKSTLIKIVAGVERAEPGGSLHQGDQAADLTGWSARAAREAGIRVVHQDIGYFPSLTVADNLAAGHGYPVGAFGNVRDRRWRRHTAEVLARFDVDARPETPMSALRPATRTMVAIGRALQDVDEERSGVLILDEPTTALPRGEVEHLFAALRRCAAAGHAIVFVSHRLSEVLALCENVTVLRDGERITSRATAGLDEHDLAELVAGRRLATASHGREAVADAPSLVAVEGLAAGPLQDVSLRVAAGEVLGIAGLLGSGRSTLLRTLFGDVAPAAGTVRLDGVPVAFRSPRQAVRAGIAYVPEDRGGDALFGSMSLDENLAAVVVGDYWQGGLLRRTRQRRESARLARELGIKTATVTQSPNELSGGNQQKAVLGRWLRTEPRLLLLDNPTQGVDVGAREDIHRLLRDAAGRGTAVVVTSDDYEELAQVCDRVVVLREGRVTGSVAAADLSADRISREIYGERAPR
ncbi:MAG: sugar ABC transporter ATP-binding protein [Nocardioidaceae bacterium]|nr:sugar ABC transporter ATP-binding protein [Nocardioidaceae bacterium]